MTAPKPGDEVRVTIKGTVNSDWQTLEQLIAANGGQIEQVDVLAPPFSVGSVMGSQSDLYMAPKGTVATSVNGVAYFKYGNSRWASSDEGIWYEWEIHGPLTIQWIPA